MANVSQFRHPKLRYQPSPRQTIWEVASVPSTDGTTYITLIQRQIEEYRHKDPHPTHDLSVPVATINFAYKTGNKSNNAAAEVSGKL